MSPCWRPLGFTSSSFLEVTGWLPQRCNPATSGRKGGRHGEHLAFRLPGWRPARQESAGASAGLASPQPPGPPLGPRHAASAGQV